MDTKTLCKAKEAAGTCVASEQPKRTLKGSANFTAMTQRTTFKQMQNDGSELHSSTLHWIRQVIFT
jgi:hypothetical protein